MEGVALPVNLNAVPVREHTRLPNAEQCVLPHLGNRHVPRRYRPSWRVADAEHPLRVVLAELRELRSNGLRHLLGRERERLSGGVRPEVVVVHADGDVHVHAEIVPAAYHVSVQVFPAVEHCADALGPSELLDGAVGAFTWVDDGLQIVGGPSGLLRADTPEEGPDLRVLQRPVYLVEQVVDALGILRLAEERAVMIEHDAVVGRRRSVVALHNAPQDSRFARHIHARPGAQPHLPYVV